MLHILFWFYFLFERGSHEAQSGGCSGTHCVDERNLECLDLPALAFWVLAVFVCWDKVSVCSLAGLALAFLLPQQPWALRWSLWGTVLSLASMSLWHVPSILSALPQLLAQLMPRFASWPYTRAAVSLRGVAIRNQLLGAGYACWYRRGAASRHLSGRDWDLYTYCSHMHALSIHACVCITIHITFIYLHIYADPDLWFLLSFIMIYYSLTFS